MATQVSNSTYDPFQQSFTITLSDGTPMDVTMYALNRYAQYGIRVSINLGTQIGASNIMLIALLFLTKHDKRRSPIFILNALALILNTIRPLLAVLYYTGSWYDAYAFFAQDYSRVSRTDYAISQTGTSVTLLLEICILASLILQIHVVLATASALLRFWVVTLSISLALVAIGLRFTLTVVNAIAISRAESLMKWQWLVKASYIAGTTSISFFSVIFITKLGFALVQRRKLGLRQFGPMQVIFIMGCQTLIIPVVISTLEWPLQVPQLQSQALTILAISMPLSSLWAARVVHDRSRPVAVPKLRKMFINSYGTSSSGGNSGRKASTTTTVDSNQAPLSSSAGFGRVGEGLGGAQSGQSDGADGRCCGPQVTERDS